MSPKISFRIPSGNNPKNPIRIFKEILPGISAEILTDYLQYFSRITSRDSFRNSSWNSCRFFPGIPPPGILLVIHPRIPLGTYLGILSRIAREIYPDFFFRSSPGIPPFPIISPEILLVFLIGFLQGSLQCFLHEFFQGICPEIYSEIYSEIPLVVSSKFAEILPSFFVGMHPGFFPRMSPGISGLLQGILEEF